MIKKKKMGRPPAAWMFQLLELKLSESWTDCHEVSELLNVHLKTVQSFFRKLDVEPTHEVRNGIAHARFKVSELKQAAKNYVKSRR